MARPVGAMSSDRLEFFQRFDVLAKQHVDPLKLMFQIAQGDPRQVGRGWEKMHRLIAARELLNYRYPKLKAIETTLDTEDKQLTITWLNDDGDPDSLPTPQISIADAPRRDAIPGDLRPSQDGENNLFSEQGN